jgi:Uma2 family endonuclease
MTLAVDIPRLESGDHLTRDEFERRYDAMPEHIKAELIEGVVYVASPVRHRQHGKPHGSMMTWIGAYYAATPGTDFGDNGTVRIDDDNEYQPDAFLRLETALGGRSSITDDDYIEGAPELIVEIAASSAAQDMNDKLKVYERVGVQEYIVWQIYERRIDWFYLEHGAYATLQPGDDGITRSHVFPGLSLDIPAILRGDLARVLTVLQQGIGSAEHAAFVERIAVGKRKQGTGNRER